MLLFIALVMWSLVLTGVVLIIDIILIDIPVHAGIAWVDYIDEASGRKKGLTVTTLDLIKKSVLAVGMLGMAACIVILLRKKGKL